jgi:hypothetical protein
MRKLTHRVTSEWSPKRTKIVSTKDKLVPNSGVEAVLYNFDQSKLSKMFLESLPARNSNNSAGSKTYGYMFLLGFLNGWDCIDDLDKLEEDYWAQNFFEGKIPGAKACGDFLRDFTGEDLVKLNKFLRDQARSYYRNLIEVHGGEKELIIDLDSTDHKQHSKKMEGLGWSYKNVWGLSSLLAYDHRGLCHGGIVRNGNANTSVGGAEMVEHCFDNLSPELKRYLRADSGYCNQDVIHACLRNKVKFVIVAHDNLNWKAKADELTEWNEWEYSDEEKQKALKRGKKLEKVEIGKLFLMPGWGEGKIGFPIIVRRFRKIKDQGTLLERFEYEYHGIITNFNLLEYKLQEVIEFYQKRANVENMIREEKHNYDLLHFPCQKLAANDAYGKLCLIAHNMLRHMAILIKPDKPMFAKKFRRNFIQIPGKIVRKSRQVFLKISQNMMKEVKQLEKAIRLGANDLSCDTC